MKKTTFALALALVACGMTNMSFARIIPTTDNPTGITVNGSTTTVKISAFSGSSINWDAFDVEKGQTVNFVDGDNAVNIITSQKASSFQGTVGAYTGEDATGEANGTISFYNAKGFSISKHFRFNGEEIMFGLNRGDGAIFDVQTGENKFFKMDSGSFNISNKGVITGGMDLTTDLDNVINIDTTGNVTLGDLTSGDDRNQGSITIEGKDIRTGNLKVANGASMAFDVSGSITTGSLTANGSGSEFDFDADKNVTVKDVTATNGAKVYLDSDVTGTPKKPSIGDVKMGNVSLEGKDTLLQVETAKTVKTGTITLNGTGESEDAGISLTATSGITTGAITGMNESGVFFRAGTEKVNATVVTGNLDLENTKMVVIVNKSVKIGDVTIVNGAIGIRSQGSVVIGDIEVFEGTEVGANGKTITTGDITLDGAEVTLDATSNAVVGDIYLYDASDLLTINGGVTAKAGNIAMDDGTINIYGTKTVTVNDIDGFGGSINLGSEEDTKASIIVNDVITAGSLYVYGASANIASVKLTGDNALFKFTGATLTTGAFTEGDGAIVSISDVTNVKVESLDMGSRSSFEINPNKDAKSIQFGTIGVATNASFNIDLSTAAVTTGLITTNGVVTIKGGAITLAGITATKDAIVNLTSSGAMDLGVVKLSSVIKQTNITAGKGLKFQSITDSAEGILMIKVQGGNTNGGTITSDGRLGITGKGNMTFGEVTLSENPTELKSTDGFVNITKLTNQADSNLQLTAATNVFTGTMTNAGIATVTAPKVTLNNLTNTGTLTVAATDGTFASTKMVEEGTSTLSVGTFDVKDYSSAAGKTTTVTASKKFAIVASDAQGNFYLNKSGTGTVKNLSVIVRKGAYFNNLQFGNVYTVENREAIKDITSARNFTNSDYWLERE